MFLLLTDSHKNAFKLLLGKDSLSGDMHSYERLQVFNATIKKATTCKFLQKIHEYAGIKRIHFTAANRNIAAHRQ